MNLIAHFTIHDHLNNTNLIGQLKEHIRGIRKLGERIWANGNWNGSNLKYAINLNNFNKERWVDDFVTTILYPLLNSKLLPTEQYSQLMDKIFGAIHESTNYLPEQRSDNVCDNIHGLDKLTLNELATITNLKNNNIDYVANMFIKATKKDNTISRSMVKICFSFLARPNIYTAHECKRLDNIVDEIFNLFSYPGENEIYMYKLVSGLSTICQGTMQEKIKTVFKFYDISGCGYITFGNMISYLESVYRITYWLEQDLYDRIGCSSLDLAKITTEEAFKKIGKSESDEISLDQFMDWANSTNLSNMCMHCDIEIADGYDTCLKCDTWVCKSCGIDIGSGYQYCLKCETQPNKCSDQNDGLYDQLGRLRSLPQLQGGEIFC